MLFKWHFPVIIDTSSTVFKLIIVTSSAFLKALYYIILKNIFNWQAASAHIYRYNVSIRNFKLTYKRTGFIMAALLLHYLAMGIQLYFSLIHALSLANTFPSLKYPILSIFHIILSSLALPFSRRFSHFLGSVCL